MAYLVPYQAVRLAALVVHPSRDVRATVKLLAAMLFFPIWHAGGVALLTYLWGWRLGFALGMLLPLCGLYSHHFGERRKAAWHDLRLLLSLGSRRRARVNLERERDLIAGQIEELAARLPS